MTMFGFLGFILILFLVIVLVAFSILGSVVRALFGIGRRNPQQQSRTYTYSNDSSRASSDDSDPEHRSSQESAASSPTGKKKIFGKDEGEYVDFEEVQ